MDRVDRRAFLTGTGAAAVGLISGGVAGAHRTRIARAAPRTLQGAIRGHVFYRGQPGFSSVYPVYNQRFDGVVPSAVARPVSGLDVAAAVRWLTAHGVPLRARSGGHSYAGYSTVGGNGVVIDLHRLNGIHVDHHAGVAHVGAGSQLIDVYAGLAAQGATIPAGSCPSVGVSGVTLGGGMGLAGRKFGLTADNVRGFDFVGADGRLRTVDAHTDPDLLWALRGGGGGNFGIVTRFTFAVHPLPSSAVYFSVSWPWSSASAAIDAWQNWAPHVRDELTSILHLNGNGGSPTITANGQYIGPASDLDGLLGPLLGVSGASRTATVTKGYLDLQLLLAGCSSIGLAACHTAPGGSLQRESFFAKSDYVGRPLNGAGRAALIGALQTSGSGTILFDAYGGAINRVPANATAFVHRHELFCMQYLVYNGNTGWLSSAWGAMRPYVSGHAYQNYIDAGLPGWQQAYYGSNYGRLAAVRRHVDPHHVFNFPQAIGR